METNNAAKPAVETNEQEVQESNTNTQSDALGEGSSGSSGAKQALENAQAKVDAELDLKQFGNHKVKLKVNKEEQSVSLQEVIKRAQLAEASEQRYNQLKGASKEAQQLKYQLRELGQLAKTNPAEFLRQAGVDPYAFSEATLSQKVKMLELPPEERARMEYEEQLRQERGRREWAENALNQQRSSHEEQVYAQQFDQEVGKIINSDSWGLPKHKYYVQLIAAEMVGNENRRQSAIQNGDVPEAELTPQEAAGIVKDRFYSQLAEIIPRFPVNQLKELLGEETLKKLREDAINQVRNQDGNQKQTSQAKPASAKKSPKVFHNETDYRAWVQSLKVPEQQ